MSAALNAFVKQAIRQQSMSFSALDENSFTAEEASLLRKRIQEMRDGKLTNHELLGGDK